MIVDAPRITAPALREILHPLCGNLRIDLAGAVALPRALPHADAFLDWLSAARHGDLDYMAREPDARLRPQLKTPWLRSVLVFAQRYTDGWPGEARDPEAAAGRDAPWTDRVSRYARGLDYHDIFRKDIRMLVSSLRRVLHRRGVIAAEGDLRSKDATDAGPYPERELAWLAGLGFFGRNTMLIHPRLGSGFFLGVALLNLEITGLAAAPRPLVGPRVGVPEGAEGMTSLCGRCTLCLEACPTDAFPEPFVLDAGRCISNWTIEWRGGAKPEQRARQGDHLFGCDICQAVCPWNHKAARLAARGALETPPRFEYAALETHADLDLADLVKIGDAEFKARFRRTPLWRCHPGGMRRNAMITAANTGRGDLAPLIRAAAAGDPDPGTRDVAAWALEQLEG